MAVGGTSLIPAIIGAGVALWGQKQAAEAQEAASERALGYLEGATQWEMQAKERAFPAMWSMYLSEIAPRIGAESPLLTEALDISLGEIGMAEGAGISDLTLMGKATGNIGRFRGAKQRLRTGATRERRRARLQTAVAQEQYKSTTLGQGFSVLSGMVGAGQQALPINAQIAQLLASVGGSRGSVYEALQAGFGDIVGTYSKAQREANERTWLDTLLAP